MKFLLGFMSTPQDTRLSSWLHQQRDQCKYLWHRDLPCVHEILHCRASGAHINPEWVHRVDMLVSHWQNWPNAKSEHRSSSNTRQNVRTKFICCNATERNCSFWNTRHHSSLFPTSMPTCKLLSVAYSACLHFDSQLQFRLTSDTALENTLH